MPKKEFLHTYLDFDFELIGIVADIKDYKMAWLLNKCFSMQLERLQDISLVFKSGESLSVSNFISEHDFATIRLIKNRAHDHNGPQIWILPECKHLDYILQIKTEIDWPNAENILASLKTLGDVSYAQRLHIQEIKSKENLLF